MESRALQVFGTLCGLLLWASGLIRRLELGTIALFDERLFLFRLFGTLGIPGLRGASAITTMQFLSQMTTDRYCSVIRVLNFFL